MRMLKRAIGGAAAAGAAITSKYIDEQLAAQRAQMLSDLQLEGQKKLDAYTNDPTRREMLRGEAAKDTAATTDAANEAGLRGKRAEATDPALAQGLADRESLLTRARGAATRQAETEAGNDPAYIKAKRALAMAGHVESSASAAQAELMRLQAADLKRLGTLYDQATAIQNDPKLTDEDKAKKLKPITTSITAIKSKTGAGAPRDPELDTVTVKESTTDDKGNITETTRKEVRRPGAGGGAPADDPVRAALEAARQAKNPKAEGGAAAAPAVAPADRPADPQRERMSLQQRAQADTRSRAQAIASQASEALRSGDPAAAQEVMGAPGFNLLDEPTKQALRRAVYGK